MSSIESQYTQLLEALGEIRLYSEANRVLAWDMETSMPAASSPERAKTMSHLSGIVHAAFIAPKIGELLAPLVDAEKKGMLSPVQAANVRLWNESYTRARVIPTAFAKRQAELHNASHHVWAQAKEAADFSKFQPNLERIVEMKREEAELYGYKTTPYDALLHDFEIGMTVEKLTPVLDSLAAALPPLVRELTEANRAPAPTIFASREVQERVAKRLATAVGFDFSRGNIGVTAHPFMMRLNKNDSRIATHFTNDPLSSVYSTVHEAGHAMYEQGLPMEHYGTPAGEAPSSGIHESQSRLWENMVGLSIPFAKFLHKVFQEEGADLSIAPEDLLRASTQVRPSFIRTESDEVTYNLHICIRYEIERRLIEGKLAVKDAPEAWNALYTKYLGVAPKNDREGVLQDVHWSAGYFGYFPTYAIGNIYSAQLYAKALKDIPNLQDGFERGEFGALLGWLRTNVHQHGSIKTADEIVKNATDSGLDATPFIEYLTTKYRGLYGI